MNCSRLQHFYFCGPTWIRTTDTCIFSAVLYQLSYRPLYNKVYLEGTPGFEPVDKGNVTSRAVTNHHPQIHLKLCGPEGNRTLHSLLAREKRQALEHASPIKLFYTWKAVKPPQLLAGWDSNPRWSITRRVNGPDRSASTATYQFFGDPFGTRTRDPLIKSQLL